MMRHAVNTTLIFNRELIETAVKPAEETRKNTVAFRLVWIVLFKNRGT